MKKILVVVLVLVVLAATAVLSLDSLAASAVEKGGTYATGVETNVGSASVGVFGGTFGLKKLTIANPPGYGATPFFSLERLSTGVALGTLTGDTVEIPKLEIDGARVELSVKNGMANYAAIMDHMKKFATAGASSEEKSGKKFVIRELIVKNVTVSADTQLLVPLAVGAKAEIALPELRLKDVGTNGGSSMGEIAGIVVTAVLNSIGGASDFLNPAFVKDLAGRVGDLGALKDQALGAIDKALGDATKQLGTGLQGGAKKLGDELGGQLGGLLGGKK